MASYREFRRRSIRRRMRRRLLFALIVILILALLGGGGWWLWQRAAAKRPAESASSAASEVTPSPSPEEVPPESSLPAVSTTDADWNRSDYAAQTINRDVMGQDDGTTAMDFRLAALPENGVVELSYFDNVTFVGDSLTQGLEIYSTGLPNAHYCAYKGIGPNAIVNGTTVQRLDKTKEIALDALVASAPNQVYILLGTNVLTRDGPADSFLAYYDAMLDMIRERLPSVTIYIQSITPVRPELQHKSPGLNQARLRSINDELSAMAVRKGCYFLDLWEVLADENGDLRADFAAGDGYHLKPAGYDAWVGYLRTHTAYTRGVAYEAGTSYYIEQ